MPNSFVFRRPFTKRGQNWLPPTKPPLGDITGSGGLVLGGAATIGYGDQVGAIVGAGGPSVGGAAEVRFVHGGQVASDIVVEWDFDNDGDFSETVEDITAYVHSAETFTGRDWPSLLTGRAGPGKLRVSLRNDDDRFNYFNAGSPLVTAPFSLKTGRRVRVRASGTASPDPALLARDRFRRADGALGDDEASLTYVEPLADDFTIVSNRAVATGEGDPHIAVLDVGAADYYVQARISVLGITANRVGIVYRYVDADNYSLCVLDVSAATLQLIDVVAGVESPIGGQGVEIYSGATVGVLVEDDTVTAYLEGVALASGTAINTSAESVGIYAQWADEDDRPEVDDLFVWDGLPAQVDGVLWTGDVAEIVSSVEAGPEKAAVVSGEGWLSKLATQHITPPASTTGRRTGLLVGNVLAGSMLLHPPGTMEAGDVTTGAFAIDDTTAMEVARRVEETELGFLYETQEGPISFRSRTARDGSTSRVTFTDAADGKFGYHRLEPYDWRREIFNRVVAGVSPWVEGEAATLFTDPGPYAFAPGETSALQASYSGTVVRWTGHSRDVSTPGPPSGITVDVFDGFGTSIDVDMPASVDAGDLLVIINGDGSVLYTWPAGWTASNGAPAVLTKVATGSEGGTSVTLTYRFNTAWNVHVYRIAGWHGTLDGVEVGPRVQGSNSSPNPPAISPSWGDLPTLFIAAYSMTRDPLGTAPSQTGVPAGYTDGQFSAGEDVDHYEAVGSARRSAVGSTENPGAFTLSSTPSWWGAATIAIRGPADGVTTQVTSSTPSGSSPDFTIGYVASIGGDTQTHSNIEVTGVPLVQGDQQLVQADDYDSQDEHNAIRTYTNPANLFATTNDAQTYAQRVLNTYADDRPILSMSFYPSKSKAYRKQALTRRVGDRITLVADHTTGFGIERDFFIEAINHKWSHGTRLWETTWELSPA